MMENQSFDGKPVIDLKADGSTQYLTPMVFVFYMAPSFYHYSTLAHTLSFGIQLPLGVTQYKINEGDYEV